MSIFLKSPDSYKRNIDPIGQYTDQAALYLSKMSGDDIETCKAFVTDGIKNGKFPGIRNPAVSFFMKQDNGDREKEVIGLSNYISDMVRNNEITVPTLTTYINPKFKRSIVVKFLDRNVKNRSVAKKEMFRAEQLKDDDLAALKDNVQKNMKNKNNSTSGGFCAKGSVINNPSGHSSLTSTTRTVASFGNASNERIIAGNRHYWSPSVTMFNLISIVANSDYVKIQRAITKYNLVYPSTEDVMNCVFYSASLYWSDRKHKFDIFKFVEKLSPLEKAAIVYSGDLYHIRILNEDFMREFITKLSSKISADVPDPEKYMRNIDDNTMALAHTVCMSEVKGLGKDYELMAEKGILPVAAGTAFNIDKIVDEYSDFIDAFLLTDNIPPSVAYIPNMLRRVVVLSDTDSTCYATDEWIAWYWGKLRLDAPGLSVGAVVSFLATQSLVHALAILSSNMNVEKPRLNVLAMKNEFMWPAMATTSVAKHYFALAGIREGNVFEKLKPEIKGVHLKNSSSPPSVIEDATKMMIEGLTHVAEGRKIPIREYIQRAADFERKISASILRGELEFYRTNKIKEKTAYKLDENKSPYKHHTFWEEVFAPVYGSIDQPPYVVAKVPTIIENPTALKNWIEGIEDKGIAERLTIWFQNNSRTEIPTIYLSANFLLSYGMVKEIVPIINVKSIVLDLTGIYRLVLEAYGCFFKEDMTLVEHGY